MLSRFFLWRVASRLRTKHPSVRAEFARREGRGRARTPVAPLNLQPTDNLASQCCIRRGQRLRAYLDRGGHASHAISEGVPDDKADDVVSRWKLESVAVGHAVALDLLQAVGFEVGVDTLRQVGDHASV